jgi:hypothetical protein
MEELKINLWDRCKIALKKMLRKRIKNSHLREDFLQDGALIFYKNFESHFNGNEQEYINMVACSLANKIKNTFSLSTIKPKWQHIMQIRVAKEIFMDDLKLPHSESDDNEENKSIETILKPTKFNPINLLQIKEFEAHLRPKEKRVYKCLVQSNISLTKAREQMKIDLYEFNQIINDIRQKVLVYIG